MKSKRKELIKDLLTNANEYVTYSDFSRKIGVSKRTVSKYIKEIETELFSENILIEKKRGVGIKLVKEDHIQKKHLEENFNDKYDILNRRLEIMRKLLFDEDYISINKLSEIYFVSKSSINYDIEIISKILCYGSNIKLVSDNFGTRLKGKEYDFQIALLQFNRFLLNKVRGYIGVDDSLEKISLLEHYYGEKLVKICKNILFNFIKQNSNVVADYYIQNVLNIYIILVYRLTKSKHHEKRKYKNNLLRDDYKNGSKYLLNTASKELNFEFKEFDIDFLENQLILNRFENVKETKESIEMVDKLIKKVSEAFGINFFDNKEFINQISKHIPAMIYRLKNHHKVDNPFTSQIKVEFPLTFNTIWISLSDYSKQYNFQLIEDEVAFLTLYFQSAIEKLKMNKKILLVCQLGNSSYEYLISKMENNFPFIGSIDFASALEIETIDLDKYDFIISTFYLEKVKKEVIMISPFLTNNDINKIKQIIYLSSKRKDQNNEKKLYNKFLFKENIFLDKNISSKEELLEKVGKDLIKKSIVKKEFIKDVIEREELGGTDLPIGVAIPHGSPKNVNSTSILLIRTKKKIKWNEYYVDIFFIICVAKADVNDTREILSHIYEIINDEKKLKKIRYGNIDKIIGVFEEE
ncbi:PRD domain-containing protein [Helcococcus ovis]|uniref:BglG family transcription antiterminator n=1 Tax=Helcococcus ovis TaxID=72026 RepID=UPI00106F52E7|nr:PTS sugar transporter subunit IIA [Helcococcus ovis]TFF68758.1 PRD domain-containing protein [Helcococcus ovis]WNZ01225.1 PTS sugar transporter subunit IIA [Helcococcus ovis]